MLRASSLPALKECPCFESSGSDFAEAGQDRHTALQSHFAGDDSLLDLLDEADRDGVLWAADYIRVHANTEEQPIRWESPLTVTLDDFSEIPGRPDAVCCIDIFDLKWRQFDYTAQMAAYALARIQELGIDATIRVHLLFACFKKVEVLKFDRETATAIIEPIAKAANDPNKQPNPCSYCGWCSNRLTCKALQARAIAVMNGREDWQLETYHTSEITKTEQMAKALRLAKHLKDWCEAVEYHAKEMAIKQGVSIPGWALKSKAGRRSIHDMQGAFNALGLPADQFLACCDVRLSTSKENPDKKGLEDIYAAAREIPKAAAKRELKKKLEPFTRTPKEILYLSPVNETQNPE